MGYFMHIASFPVLSEKEQNTLEQAAVSSYAEEFGPGETGRIPAHELIKAMHPLQIFDLHFSIPAEKLLCSCSPFFTELIRKEAPWLTSDPEDPDFAGILTQPLLLELIRSIHQEQADLCEQKLKTLAEDPEMGLFLAREKLRHQLHLWQKSMKKLTPENGALPLPVIESHSAAAQLIRLAQIWQTLDPGLGPARSTAVLYGW